MKYKDREKERRELQDKYNLVPLILGDYDYILKEKREYEKV